MGYGSPPAAGGDYSQIPLDNDLLIPYTDLGAGAGYGRKLILPDDMIPTLGLQTLVKHPNGPRLWTGKNVEGAADVYVVGQSGGGGGGSGAVAYNADFSGFFNGYYTAGGNDNIVANVSVTTAVYGVSYSVAFFGNNSPATQGIGTIWISAQGNQHKMFYLAFFLESTLDPSIYQQTTITDVVNLIPPLDPVATFGTTDLQVGVDAGLMKMAIQGQLLFH